MSQDEEISLMRRELADLRERVARLETQKLPAVPISAAAPQIPTPFYVGTLKSCGCPAGANCGSAACPRSPFILCGAGK